MTIRYLVATVQSHGARPADFHWADEGEPVSFSPDLHFGHQYDHPCGCARAFIGAVTGRTTTTTRVADLDITRNELITPMYESQALFNRREIADGVDEMLDVLATWPAGTVVERRGDILVARMTPDEADAWEEAHGAETRARNESARAAAQRAADSNVNRFLRRPAPSEWGRQ